MWQKLNLSELVHREIMRNVNEDDLERMRQKAAEITRVRRSTCDCIEDEPLTILKL